MEPRRAEENRHCTWSRESRRTETSWFNASDFNAQQGLRCHAASRPCATFPQTPPTSSKCSSSPFQRRLPPPQFKVLFISLISCSNMQSGGQTRPMAAQTCYCFIVAMLPSRSLHALALVSQSQQPEAKRPLSESLDSSNSLLAHFSGRSERVHSAPEHNTVRRDTKYRPVYPCPLSSFVSLLDIMLLRPKDLWTHDGGVLSP